MQPEVVSEAGELSSSGIPRHFRRLLCSGVSLYSTFPPSVLHASANNKRQRRSNEARIGFHLQEGKVSFWTAAEVLWFGELVVFEENGRGGL